MVVKSEYSVVANPSPNNVFAQYKSSFSAQANTKASPLRLRRNAPTKSGSYRSARSARSALTEERVDVEAYDPFNNDDREEVEDSASLFSEENSRDLWPSMPAVSTATQDDEDFLPETGPTGTPKRKRTGSTPYKPPKPTDGDDDGFTDGFRVSYTSSTPQLTSKSSVSSNFSKTQSHPFDEFRTSSIAATPTRAAKPSVLDKYKPSGSDMNYGTRASYSASPAPRRLSQSSASSNKNDTNETEPTNGFRSSYSSAFTPQRGARLSIGSTNSATSANSASQVSNKSSVSNKYTANLSQPSETPKNHRVVASPLRIKKSSVSNRWLNAVASKEQDDTPEAEASAVDVPAKVEVQTKKEEPENVDTSVKKEPEKPSTPRRSSSFSSAQNMWKTKEQPKKTFTPLRKSSIQQAEDDTEENIEFEKVETPVKDETKRPPAPTRTSSFSSAQNMWKTKEQPMKNFTPYRKSSTQKAEDEVETTNEPEQAKEPAKIEPEKPPAPKRTSSFSSAQSMWKTKEQPTKTFTPQTKTFTQKTDDDMEETIETKIAIEMAKMKIQFDEEVQRIEERMEQKYMERIEALEAKTDTMNKIIGKMITKRKSMDNSDMDRVEV